MKQTNIFLRWICLAMLLGCAGVSWGQMYLETAGGTLTSGNYEIEKGKNLTISNTIVIPSNADVTIELNGLVLAGGEGLEYVIKVEEGGKLTIKDSDPTLAHGGKLNEKAYYILDWVGENGTKPFYGGTIYNEYVDEKTNRKGIEVSGECIIERANIMGCYSTTYGAAVTVNGGGSFTMNGGEISYNCAVQNGGGIYSNGSLSIKNAYIQYNKALGVDAPQNASTKVNNGYGGGIYVSSSSEEVRCYIEGSEINHNYAAVFGGGIYSRVNTTIMNSKIQHNRAMHSEKVDDVVTWNAGRGGGFCFIGGGNGETAQKIEFVLDNTKVEYNACMYYGGGGHIATGAFLTQKNGTTINNNVAILHGAGGLHVTAGANFIFEDGEISNNVAHSVGGGIHSSYDCTLDLTGGTISHNTAHHRGGGVHVNTGGVLTLKGTNITDNEVLNGKDYKYSTVTFNSDGRTSWSSPTSDSDDPYKQAGYGGGVLIDAGHCFMNSGELSNNKAEVGGGGLALVMINTDVDINKIDQLKVVQFTLNGGTIQGNTTEGQGAGIYLMENTMEEPTGDTSGVEDVLDALLNGTPEAFIYGGTLTENVAQGDGGALLVNGNVTMTDGTFTKNKANNGGGICIIGGTVDITKGNIIENEAINYGGGIYVENTDPDAVITLSGDGVFEKNIAKAGGGMAVKGPFTFNFAGTLQNNNAVNGGGIYLLKATDTTKGATLHFNGGFIRNNTATGTAKLTDKTAYQKDVGAVTGVGGGVFMADYTTLDFNVTNTLGFYGNRATNAADDIFANGKGTSVTLPAVKDMALTDFSVPAGELYWIEDYYSHYADGNYESDSQYGQGINKLKDATDLTPSHNVRYQHALQNAMVTRIEKTKVDASNYVNYVCLALGYQIFYVTIQKTGLEVGESALFNILSEKAGDKPYITMLLTGSKDQQTVEKRVALPEGKWKVQEQTGWSWSYVPSGETTLEEEVNSNDVIFSFTNAKNPEATTGLHDEDIQVNEMGKKKDASAGNE